MNVDDVTVGEFREMSPEERAAVRAGLDPEVYLLLESLATLCSLGEALINDPGAPVESKLEWLGMADAVLDAFEPEAAE